MKKRDKDWFYSSPEVIRDPCFIKRECSVRLNIHIFLGYGEMGCIDFLVLEWIERNLEVMARFQGQIQSIFFQIYTHTRRGRTARGNSDRIQLNSTHYCWALWQSPGTLKRIDVIRSSTFVTFTETISLPKHAVPFQLGNIRVTIFWEGKVLLQRFETLLSTMLDQFER